ncbi:hypothetical protein ACFWIA_14850 [Streptomyces sp. NPDC127068]|uniref:hypothetical protein n=1 Tax=Streptomyces sp. NPDC127068 TaxID=3347127 RepID=UPI00366650A1
MMTNRSPLCNVSAVQPVRPLLRLSALVLLLLGVALAHGVYADSAAGHAAAHLGVAPAAHHTTEGHGPAPADACPAPVQQTAPDGDHAPAHPGEHCASGPLPSGPSAPAQAAAPGARPAALPHLTPAGRGTPTAPLPGPAAGRGSTVVQQV